MVWAISHTGDSLLTWNNGNLSRLEVNNISLVVLLVKKENKQSSKYDGNTKKLTDSFGLSLRGAVCIV